MSEQIREQVSAFLDGELPNSETELLLKRLTRDPELRDSFGRYALIGESLRGGGSANLSQGFAGRVNRAIDGEPETQAVVRAPRAPMQHWWRPLTGVAVAAGVCAVAVLALQQRAVAPGVATAGLGGPAPINLPLAGNGQPREALSYTVPATVADAPTAMPAARLTNYVFAHSRYSSGLGQNNMLSGLLTETDEQDAAAAAANRAASEADGAELRSQGTHGNP